MPYKDPDPTDPNVLVGVVLPAETETIREMAYAFAEEFVQMGYGNATLLAVFKSPFYAAAHGAYRALGEGAIRKIVAECLAAWGGIQFSILDSGFSIEREAVEKNKIQNRKPEIQNHAKEGEDG